jgi:hypothetical protein
MPQARGLSHRSSTIRLVGKSINVGLQGKKFEKKAHFRGEKKLFLLAATR